MTDNIEGNPEDTTTEQDVAKYYNRTILGKTH